MRLSEFFIATSVGEPLVVQKYGSSLQQDNVNVFRQMILEQKASSLKPHMAKNDMHYYNIKRQGLYFVATVQQNVSPLFVIEFLSRVYQLCKDFCGVVNEEAIKANYVLINEILEEILDYGYVQLASTDKIKPYMQSEPVVVKNRRSQDSMVSGLFGAEHRTVPHEAANKPVIRSKWDQERRKNEIFVDVVERLTVIISPNGVPSRSELHGQVNMRSFLVGCPSIKLGLNEDLVIGKESVYRGYGNVAHLDACHFSNHVQLNDFQDSRMLSIHPPEGEFCVMRYAIQSGLPRGLPFRLYTVIDDTTDSRSVLLILKLRCETTPSSKAVDVSVNIPVPKLVKGVTSQLCGPGQTADFNDQEKQIQWKIKKIQGREEISANFKLFLPPDGTFNKLEVGPVAMNFELSDFCCSNLQVRFLRVYDKENSYVPFRWVRYVVVTDSYIFKLS